MAEGFRGVLDRLLASSKRRPESWGLLLAGGAIAAGFEVARILFRNVTLFHPSRKPVLSWNPADYGIDPSSVNEVNFESYAGHLLHGWYCRARDPIASALFCHGNTGNLTLNAPNIPKLLESGISIFVFDYRGYGRSTGLPTVRGLIEDARAAAKEHDRVRPPFLPSILYGYSLGGAVAIQIARRTRFDGLVLQSTFTNLRDMARHRFGAVPVHLVVGNEFDSLEAIKKVDVPLLVVHGTEDKTVPHWMGQQLFDAHNAGKELMLVDGGAHTNLFAVDSDRVVESIRRLALRLRAVTEPRSLVSAVNEEEPRYRFRRHVRRMMRGAPDAAPGEPSAEPRQPS